MPHTLRVITTPRREVAVRWARSRLVDAPGAKTVVAGARGRCVVGHMTGMEEPGIDDSVEGRQARSDQAWADFVRSPVGGCFTLVVLLLGLGSVVYALVV